MTTLIEQNNSLPQDREHQTYVSVKAICAGNLWLPDCWVFQDSEGLPESIGSWAPDLCFLITHPTKGRAMFDLGMRKHAKGHPPGTEKVIESTQATCERGVAEILQSEGVEPADVDIIILSHLHWDHVGDPAPFTSAEIVLGAEAVSLLATAYPKNPKSPYHVLPANRRVSYIHFKDEHAHLAMSPFGPFDRAVDLYGDGSLYLVDAPGHVAGHLLAAARVGPNSFVFLAGDACHGRECYAGTRAVSGRVHEDAAAAKDTVERLVRLNGECGNAVIVLAHEKERVQEMPMFPAELNRWAMGEIERMKGLGA